MNSFSNRIRLTSKAACGLLTAGLLLGACASNAPATTPATPGTLVSSDSIATYDSVAFEKIRTVETVFGREEAPSNPEASLETRLALLQFASQGYLVVAADYFGNGPLSTVPNAYFLKRSTEQAMFDMHTASLAFLTQRNIRPGHLFLLGWSQGGYNTMLHFRQLEGAGIPVAATATASGPASPYQLITRGL